MKIKRYISYWKSVITLKRQQKLYQKQALLSAVAFPVTKTKAVFADKADDAGFLPHHYFFQDLYVAQRIYQNNPAKHIDIGSRIDGFVAHVAAFRKIEIYDIRPMKKAIPNVQFTQCDLMKRLRHT
ncbi:hypothetical protein AGMMS49525_09700 [Bacteroidia bacterium]|nr:hypothetical protein AGMMS49525_09700 [Bacteroidia bacterium]